MCQMISCLVDVTGKVYAVDGVHSHSAIAARCGVDEDKCLKYEFDLTTRKLKQDFNMDRAPFAAKQSHDEAAQRFVDDCAGTPTKLIAYVKRGNWLPYYLLPLLTAPARAEYERVTAPARAEYGRVAAPTWAEYGRVAAAAEAEYGRVTAAAWCKLFRLKANRIEAWR